MTQESQSTRLSPENSEIPLETLSKRLLNQDDVSLELPGTATWRRPAGK